MARQAIQARPCWDVTPQKVEAAVRRAVESVHPERVYVFGDDVDAKRGGGPAQDLNMLVVLGDAPYGDPDRLSAVMRDIPMAMSVVVTSRRCFDEDRAADGSLFKDAVLRGRLVHTAY